MAHSVVTLDKAYDLKSFDCGIPALNTWLRTIARQHQKKSLSSTFVLVDDEFPESVIGFYALAIRGMAATEDLPPSITKRLPLEVSGITLARLAVAAVTRIQGNANLLLIDAMIRAKHVASRLEVLHFLLTQKMRRRQSSMFIMVSSLFLAIR